MLNTIQVLPYPILGSFVFAQEVVQLDLSITNPDFESTNVRTYEGCEQYIHSQLHQANAKVGIGGYLEHRIFYQESDHFGGADSPRCIHLGVDLWADAGTWIYAPVEGRVHSFQYNPNYLDYGATIILEHRQLAAPFFTLYGHLSIGSLQKLKKGQVIRQGQPFATFGNRHENGGWVPHLHFQVMTTMLDFVGDFPGVSTLKEQNYWAEICLDPAPLIRWN